MTDAYRNLVCILGANGAGKTRTLRKIKDLLGHSKVLHLGAERIVADLIEALNRNGSISHVSDPLRAIEHLLIDNFWVLASRPSTASVVRDLLEARIAADRLTVLVSDLTLDQWAARQPETARLLSSGAVVQLS